jgi:hypothetical protein
VQLAEAHAERLRIVAERHSLSEIARRTGKPVSCIHGYLHGTRIPAELFSGLVREFGVNPAWLHTGDGPIYSSDIAPETASMAEDVLRLVESMEAVGKMRLGAMSGNQPRVRALEDALKRHEQLQGAISGRTDAVLKKLLDDAEAAVLRRDYAVAEASLATAARLQKLSTNQALAVRRMNLEGFAARLRGLVPQALEKYREAFLQMLPLRLKAGDEAHAVAFNYSNTLSLLGEIHEAIAVADGMLTLGASEPTDSRINLDAHRGWLDVLNGQLLAGLARIARNLPLVTELRRRRIEAPRYMFAQMLGGMLDFDAAVKGVEDSPNKAAFLTMLVLCTDDVEKLAMLFDRYYGDAAGHIEDAKGRIGTNTATGTFVAALVALHRDKDDVALERYDRYVASLKETVPMVHRFSALVNHCQIARLAGGTADARRHLRAAERTLASLPAAVVPELTDLARHHRNTVLLVPRSAEGRAMSDRARAWFAGMIQQGYMYLRPMGG